MKVRGNLLRGESSFIESKEVKMKESQFNVLSQKLIKTEAQRDALRLHMLFNYSAYEAEKITFGKATSTVGRDAKRIKAAYDFAIKVHAAAYYPKGKR